MLTRVLIKVCIAYSAISLHHRLTASRLRHKASAAPCLQDLCTMITRCVFRTFNAVVRVTGYRMHVHVF